MKKTKAIAIYLTLALLIIIVMIHAIFNFLNSKSLRMNQCSATINEISTSKDISTRFERVISIISDKGFARDTGFLIEGDEIWRINRFYTFSLKHLSGHKYELKVLSYHKAEDDKVPSITLIRLRPEQGRNIYIPSIEEVSPNVWLFSGLTFPLFACKELNPNW